MSEFRQNLLTQEWVIIAPERGLKPKILKEEDKKYEENLPEYISQCPFCPENEKIFPHTETFRTIDKNGKWITKTIENKYKLLATYVSCPVKPERFENDGIYMKYDGCGLHEVIIETPFHNKIIPTMTRKEVENIISTYYQRYIEFGKNPNNLITIIFKNHGVKAGASQPHAHSQIVGSRIVPLNIRYILIEAQRFFDKQGICTICEVLDFEFKENKRIVYQNDSFVSIVPYAAAEPYETWIIPKLHKSGFNKITENEKSDFADILHKILIKFHKALNNPDFNYVIHSAPYPLSDVPFFHWYLRMVPRIKISGGFEIGTRISVNPVYPEESAEMLKIS